MLTLNPGEKVQWPSSTFSSDEVGIFAVLKGTSVFRLPSNFRLPGIPKEIAADLQFELRATQFINLNIYDDIDEVENLEWFFEQLSNSFQISNESLKGDTLDDVIVLLREVAEGLEIKANLALQSFSPINQASEQQLFRWLESDESAISSKSNELSLSQDHALLDCIAKILKCSRSDLNTVNIRGTDSRLRLQQMLELNNLIGREVIVNDESFKNECGDLIAFSQENNASPVLLRSNKKVYTLWDPKDTHSPLPIAKCQDRMEQLSPRMISILPTLQKKDLTTVGLIQFTFGKSNSLLKFIIAGLLSGVAIGFLLSIGREVGAARWIFSMATTGTILGGALGLVTGGFRSGIAAMLIVTLLSLLTPTFNTIITNQALPDQDLSLLLQISLVLLAAGFARVGLEWVQSRDLMVSQQKGAAKLQLASMKHALELPTDFYRQRSIGELQSRFGAIDEIREEIQELIQGGIVESLLITLYILFMLRISVKLTLLAVFVAMIMVLPTLFIAYKSRSLQRFQEEEKAEAEGRNLELINSVSKLRIAGAEAAAAKWWAKPYKNFVNLEIALDAKQATSELLQNIIPNLGNLLLYIVVTRLIAEAANSSTLLAPNVGQLLGFFSAFGTFIGGIAGLADAIENAIELPIYYERSRPIFDTETEDQNHDKESVEVRGDIQFDRVSYRYEDDLPLVLDSVSLHIKAGEYVAIVGPSGSGKSTLIRLILGFSKPEDGTIRFDGRPLNGLDLRSLRRQIGTVLQSNSLFSGSIMEAISGGVFLEEEAVWHAAELAGLAEDIRKMPMGLQTVLPDGGGTLSGGQCQRIAIARALARNPRLLIFDEATSALDNRTQAIVTASLDKLPITRITIAHRLSTIRKADRIIVINNGQVEEDGDYETLYSNNRLFTRLMRQQIK